MRSSHRFVALALATMLTAIGISQARASQDPRVTVRQRFFGIENVDPTTGAVRSDRVILSWFGVTNFAASIGGHVVLLDAWIPRGEYSGYVPATVDDLVTLDPEAVFIGHGHFDHAADASEVVARTGATLVGTPGHCDQAREQAADVEVTCVLATRSGDEPGAIRELGVLARVGITSVLHVHSAAESPDPDDPHTPAIPPPDANAFVGHLPAPQDTIHLLQHLGDAEGGSLLYQFRVGDFALTWHDSSGPLKEQAPHVLDVIADLPAPTDVQLGAIMGFNQITNGMRDPRMYIEAIEPKIFVPQHHDNWAPPVSTRGEHYEPLIAGELERIPAERRPILRFISDPQDYVRPEVLTFDVGAPAWR